MQVNVALARHIDARRRLVRNVRLEAELRCVDAGDDGDENVGRAIILLRDLHVLHVLVGHVLILNLDGVGEERRALALDILVINKLYTVGLFCRSVFCLHCKCNRCVLYKRNRHFGCKQLCAIGELYFRR